MANFINKYADITAYEIDETKQYPNVSYIDGDSIVFAETVAPPYAGLTVYYNVVDPSVDVTLFNGGGSSSSSSSSESGGGSAVPASMKVDGNDEAVISSWRFATAGVHIVKYTFENGYMNVDFNVSNAIKAIYGTGVTSIASSFISIGYEIYMASETPPSIVDDGTYSWPADIYVPEAGYNAYINDQTWGTVALIIHPIQ